MDRAACMGSLKDVATISRWEIKKSFSLVSRDIIPVAVILFILLVIVTGFAAQSGMHIQDGMYRVGVNDPEIASLVASDPRFTVYSADSYTLFSTQEDYDLVIVNGIVYPQGTEKAQSALSTLQRDYTKYKNSVYTTESDLFAAYPLWIDTETVTSELDFSATRSGQYIQVAPGRQAPVPEGTVVEIPPPSATLGVTKDELRSELVTSSSKDSQVTRYTDILSPQSSGMGSFVTPDQLSPPLPFDSIILVFIFIFPLYFTSQFFMMSIMNERIERRGEVLLSVPVKTPVLILGKMLPYFLGMLAICAGLTLWIGASPITLLPLIPIILFFLANALVIGMVARSFKELSFVSIFFSTVATSYLFFPSIFANVHVISYISPLTLIVLTIQGTAWTAADFVYSTALFWLTAAILFYLAAINFKEERLFSEKPLLPRLREFLSEAISDRHPYASLFVIAALTIPFVFMAQMMGLVLFFNLPMPLSLVLLILLAALIEEIAKAAGLYTLFMRNPSFFTWKRTVIAAAVIALGFLAGEKLLLFATLSQITESVFGSVLFLSLGVLWLPFLLHFLCVLIVGCSLKKWGSRGLFTGLIVATAIHCLYNLYFILGWVL
ncbi:MAG: ABC transporter permease [Methanoregula sp.]|jgi:ABC-type Na+ efflux pump permease subunit